MWRDRKFLGMRQIRVGNLALNFWRSIGHTMMWEPQGAGLHDDARPLDTLQSFMKADLPTYQPSPVAMDASAEPVESLTFQRSRTRLETRALLDTILASHIDSSHRCII